MSEVHDPTENAQAEAPRLTVMVWYRSADSSTILDAHRGIAAALDSTPGLLAATLYRSTSDDESFLVVSEWLDPDAFARWETGADHKGQTAPLRPYTDARRRPPYETYVVVEASVVAGRPGR